MKKILILSLSLIIAFAQAQTKEVPKESWYHADFESTGIYGVNTQKALDFLKEKKRKASPLVVGVLDSGVEITHEDLKNNLWTNPKEKTGNSIDDDKNGYIDDINGWNFIGGKDGKNVNEDTLESTRLLKYYTDLFGDVSKLDNKVKLDKAKEIEEYQKIKKEVEEGKANAIASKQQYENLYKNFSEGFEQMLKDLGDVKLTDDVFNKYQPNELAAKGMAAFAYIPKEEWENKSLKTVTNSFLKQIEDGIEYFGNQAEYYYNVDFDSRSIVGDDYKNKQEKNYGNNTVIGPDASHGTHVAGIIAAENNNNLGIDGIGGNNIKILTVRVVPNGDERDKDVANAIRYAVDNGAKILNMSFGKSYSPEKELVWSALKYANDNNVLLVKAAGNDNVNIDTEVHYPTNFYENGEKVAASLLTVGANTKDPTKLKSSFSNYGKKSVDVFAPGSEIYSTYTDNSYKFENGTSMASPVVAGVAALIWSHYPDLSAVQIKNIICNSVNKNDQLTEFSVTGGVVDAYKAVQLAEELSVTIKSKTSKGIKKKSH